MDPANMGIDEAVVRQMKVIYDDIHRLWQTQKVSDGQLNSWQEYINGVADDLQQLPMYKGPEIDITPDLAFAEGYLRAQGKEQIFPSKGVSYPTKEKGERIDELNDRLATAAESVRVMVTTRGKSG